MASIVFHCGLAWLATRFIAKVTDTQLPGAEIAFVTLAGGQGPDFDSIGSGANALCKRLLKRKENVLPDALLHRGAAHSKYLVPLWALLFEVVRATLFGGFSLVWFVTFCFLGTVHLTADHINGPLGQMIDWPFSTIRHHSKYYVIPDTIVFRTSGGKLDGAKTARSFLGAFGFEVVFLLLPFGAILSFISGALRHLKLH